jgi:hypothetical protein
MIILVSSILAALDAAMMSPTVASTQQPQRFAIAAAFPLLDSFL